MVEKLSWEVTPIYLDPLSRRVIRSQKRQLTSGAKIKPGTSAGGLLQYMCPMLRNRNRVSGSDHTCQPGWSG